MHHTGVLRTERAQATARTLHLQRFGPARVALQHQPAPHGCKAKLKMERTVLLIEDNAENRVIYATCLEASGYRVIEAIRGEAGLELAVRAQPDLILMDLHLPGLSGLEATRQLKQDPATADIPIYIITASAEEMTRDALAAGCEAVLAKPIDPLRVRDVVTEHLARMPDP
jgi:CheY-like chemotaxis protein